MSCKSLLYRIHFLPVVIICILQLYILATNPKYNNEDVSMFTCCRWTMTRTPVHHIAAPHKNPSINTTFLKPKASFSTQTEYYRLHKGCIYCRAIVLDCIILYRCSCYCILRLSGVALGLLWQKNYICSRFQQIQQIQNCNAICTCFCDIL